MSECRYGSLPWFAGLWWLGVCWAMHWAARGAVELGWFRLAWVLVRWTERTSELSIACAREGGAE